MSHPYKEVVVVCSDFGALIQRYVPHNWKIVKVGNRAAQVFAQHCVLGEIAVKRDTKVKSLSRAMRRLWVARLKELVVRQLWLPNVPMHDVSEPQFDQRKFELTFRRCLFCRPTYMYYRWKRQAVFRPCNRDMFCPFCFARICAWQYRHVKTLLRAIGKQKTDTPLVMTGRIVSRFIEAPGFHPTLGCPDSQIRVYAQILRGELKRHQYAYNKCTKRLQRHTVGSMCRTVVIPQETGWNIETRQFFLHKPKLKLPAVRLAGAKVRYFKSSRLRDDYALPETSSEFFFLLAAINQYPKELLTGYTELVAAYLHASHDMRLMSGTGLCRKTGRSLGGYFKQKDADAKATRKAKKALAALPAVSDVL